MRTSVGCRRAGLTLVELVVALGLASFLMAGLFQLLDSSLELWRRNDTRQGLLEQSSVAADLLSSDLRAIENTGAGDFLAEWVPFDTDRDGTADSYWPRMRLVRRASKRELARLKAGLRKDFNDRGLIEVVWGVRPFSSRPDQRAEGLLWRGERLVGDRSSRSFFDERFLGRRAAPPAGTVETVTRGVLWMRPLFATQTSVVHNGWKTGDRLEHAATSWDAWNKERPDPTHHHWNSPGAGMPKTAKNPLLPRRIRIEYEFERAVDRKRRTRLNEALNLQDATFSVGNGERLPSAKGAHVKVGSEWMRILSVNGDRVSVVRGQRGTRPVTHKADEMVHWGMPGVTEISVELYREDWNL